MVPGEMLALSSLPDPSMLLGQVEVFESRLLIMLEVIDYSCSELAELDVTELQI